MDQNKLNQFRARLEALRDELETTIRDETGQTDIVQLDGSLGRLSRMDAMQSQAMARALQQRQQQQLLRVQSALQRIKQGTYGQCGRCRGPIGEERLDAQPEVVLCVQCAAQPQR